MSQGVFGRALVVAIIAALALFPWMMLVGPWLGRDQAFALFALTVAVCYPLATASNLRQGVRGTLLSAGLATLGALVVWSPGQRLLLAALLLAVVRSSVLYGQRAARGMAIEVFLALLGTGFAMTLSGPGAGLISMSLALWSYLLVQSVYFLIGEASPTGEPARDAFEQARDRAREIMSLSKSV